MLPESAHSFYSGLMSLPPCPPKPDAGTVAAVMREAQAAIGNATGRAADLAPMLVALPVWTRDGWRLLGLVRVCTVRRGVAWEVWWHGERRRMRLTPTWDDLTPAMV